MRATIKRLLALCLTAAMCMGSVNVSYAQETAASSDSGTSVPAAEEIQLGSDDDSKESGGNTEEIDVTDEELPPVAEEGTDAVSDGDEIIPDDEVVLDEKVPRKEIPANDISVQAETEESQSEKTAGQSGSEAETAVPSVSYRVHIQDNGWLDMVENGETAGTTGQKKRIEALQLELTDVEGLSGSINYRVHVQNYGWLGTMKDGQAAGTTGEKRQVEAVQIYLTGAIADVYDVYYTVHIAWYGWMQWTKGSADDTGICGSTGLNLQAEAIQVKLVKKGETAPNNGAASSYLTPYSFGTVMYSGHQQNEGNLSAVYDGATLGITGKSERLEAIKVEEGDDLRALDGDIIYRVHVQDYGTQGWVSSGTLAGTTGKSKRLEAVQMALTDELDEQFDIYYRVHIQDIGWLKWTKGTQESEGWTGSSGFALRCEAIQVKILPKGTAAPSDNAKYRYITENDIPDVSYSGHQQSYGNLSAVSNGTTLGHTGHSFRLEAVNISLNKNAGTQLDGSIQYRAHVQSDGWKSWVSNGATAGTTGQSKRLEAIEIKLTGSLADFFDVWYRVHVQEYGWLGWAKNGQTAGSTGINYRIEAIQIKIVPRYQPAPGANTGYYKNMPAMSAVDQRIYNYCQSVYNSVGRNLYSCYNWVVNNLSYQSLGVPSLPSGYSSRSQWYAIKAFSEHRGNCYCYAAAFYYLTKYLGYNAQYVEGRVTAASGGYTPHGWVVINGAYICDPEAQYEIGGYNFYMQPIGNTVLNYIR